MSVQLPFGLNQHGRMISIHDAERGLACGCFCPECNRRLVAKKGEEIAHHFAHEADTDCAGAVESMLHKLAKQTIADAGYVWFPDAIARYGSNRRIVSFGGLFQASVVDVERRIGDIQPDALLSEGERQLAVEVYVTHGVTSEKKLRYRELGLPCIEIDLSSHHGPHHANTPSDHLPDIILRSAPRWWVHLPKVTAVEAELQAEHAAREQQRRDEQTRIEAARAAHEAERLVRLTAEQRADEERRAIERAAYEARMEEQRSVNEARWAKQQAELAAQEKAREAERAAYRVSVKHYRDAERTEASHWYSNPYHWRAAVHHLASKFLIQNDADAWMEKPLDVKDTHSVRSWPFTELPTDSQLNAIYDELWAEIVMEGRYRGP